MAKIFSLGFTDQASHGRQGEQVVLVAWQARQRRLRLSFHGGGCRAAADHPPSVPARALTGKRQGEASSSSGDSQPPAAAPLAHALACRATLAGASHTGATSASEDSDCLPAIRVPPRVRAVARDTGSAGEFEAGPDPGSPAGGGAGAAAVAPGRWWPAGGPGSGSGAWGREVALLVVAWLALAAALLIPSLLIPP